MGLFNWVNTPKINCPSCQAELSGWQTKDEDEDQLYCDQVDFKTVRNFYTGCGKCQRWVEFNLKVKPISERTLDDYEMTSGEI